MTLKCPCHQFVLFLNSKGHIKKGTSAKKFFDLIKTRISYDFFNPTFVWFIPSAERESTGSSLTSYDVVPGTLVAVARRGSSVYYKRKAIERSYQGCFY